MKRSNVPTSNVRRRQLLGGFGVAMGLPLLESMVPRRASAAASESESGIPRRMLVAHFGTGMNLHEFFPDQTGESCELKRITKPLQDFRKRMTILSGMQLEHGGGHTGDYTFLTGTKGWSSSGIEGGISADQVVAKQIGGATRFPSMQFSIDRGTNFGNQGLATLSWSENGIPLAAENDPYVLFGRMFQSDDPAAAKMRDAQFRRRGSILDLVTEQAKSMERGVSNDDKRKLDEYFTSVAEIEHQLKRDIDWSTKPKPQPELAGIGDYSVSLTPDSREFDYDRYQKLMYDLVVLAFKTDSTRVITYNVRQELRGGVFPVHGVSKGFHALTHHNNDPKNLDELAKVDEINMRYWRGLLERLDSVPQADGRSLLDHTVLAFSSSAGMDHSRDRLPTIVFGGEALGIKHKTHLRLPEKTPLAGLWHTMAHAMGAQVDQMQDSHGVISELLS
ncbi:DUF1552 domain-containing protein [Stieleria varia]|uniref:Secreted protein containing DUF1552 n=1 Tax=Stieleria varia TaxID=2528005 RepID=A0A5C6ATB7_9BACT|nr:DUF1552 domain-containing protein [Stieleria varia]TWU02808.1 hypothetical protein Pla52n_38680 [Stieleria varia]